MGLFGITMDIQIKNLFLSLLNKFGDLVGLLLIAPFALIFGILSFWQVTSAVLIPAWLIWEFWPFQNQFSQKLAYTEIVETNSAVMKKINIIEFELDIDEQRVIQKIVAPLRSDRGRPPLCSFFANCHNEHPSVKPEENGFRELREQLPLENQILSELKNCVVKSSDDWICESKWYGVKRNMKGGYIGKSDGEWIFQPSLSNLKKWKAGLLIDQLRCGGNVCFVMSMDERKSLFDRIENSARQNLTN